MAAVAWVKRLALVSVAAAALVACATVEPRPQASASGAKIGQPYQVNGVWYVPREQPDYDQVGTASWYGDAFHLKATASGEIFDMNAVSGAHTTLPLPCMVEVTNLDNGRRLMVRVNDRGPFVGDRIIDLSHEAARQLGFDRKGLARVRVRYVGPAPLGRDAGLRVAAAHPPRRSGPRYATRLTPSAPSSATQSAGVALASAPAAAGGRRLQILPVMPANRASSASASPPPGAYRIQAGAFSEEAKARRAVGQLSAVGPAVIEPLQRGGVTLYRVLLPAPADELQAFGLRQRVAEAGFEDARVIRPF